MSLPGGQLSTAPVARALARATTSRDVKRLRQHPESVRRGWGIEYDGDVTIIVTLAARQAYHATTEDIYTVALTCDAYDVWPPEVKFVNPSTLTYVVGEDRRHMPVVEGFPNFGLHPQFSSFCQPGRVDQLVCFSYTRGYYDSAHTPTSDQRWVQGRHWLYATIAVLHRTLQPPFYRGRAS